MQPRAPIAAKGAIMHAFLTCPKCNMKSVTKPTGAAQFICVEQCGFTSFCMPGQTVFVDGEVVRIPIEKQPVPNIIKE